MQYLSSRLRAIVPRPKAWFVVYRALAVLVWAQAIVVVTSAVAYKDVGRIDWLNFSLVFVIASLVQGYPAHVVNEITDWMSGTDQYRKLGEKSGGSKVLKAGLATVPQLWLIFWSASLLTFGLTIWLYWRIDWLVVVVFVLGYFVSVAYTLPPFRFAYRPFAGEWLGGFPGVCLTVLGSYYAQTRQLTAEVVLFGVGLGFVYVSVMMLFHYLDYESDMNATPQKRTTIVYLGLDRAKIYVLILMTVALAIMIVCTVKYHIVYTIAVVFCLLLWSIHANCNPKDANSIVHSGKNLTYVIMAFSVVFPVVVAPMFLWMIVLIGCSLAAHRRFGKIRG